MSSTKKPAHTPGPWATDGTGMGISTANANLDFKPMVASTAMADVSLKDARANARLIASAPELLGALQGLLQEVSVRIDDPRVKLFDAARAAIAKATGEAA